MKKAFADTLEVIEGIIETIEPGTVVSLRDIATKANVTMTSATRKAIILLLMKYGIMYKDK